MMINKKIISGLMFILLSALFTEMAGAQTYTRVFDFKKGDEFQSEIIITSNAMIKRGKQVLNVSSTNNLTKSYKIQQADDQGYKFAVAINKMKAAIDANKIRTSFDTDNKTDTTSNILQGLFFVVNKPIAVTISKNGSIQNAEEYKLEMASDTLISFAGLQPEIFKKGQLINFLADFTYRKDIKKGYTWTDSTTVTGEKAKTRFLVDHIDENITILNFFKTSTNSLLNTNSNGTYVIDNRTGLIVEKYVYIIAVGYQVSAGNMMYAVSRTVSIVEKTKKVPK